jgi:prevent-host-death family protein
MRSYPLHEARSKLSTLIARALKGEPQRVTRHGKEAVIIVAEKDWKERPKTAPTLADLFLATAGADARGFTDVLRKKLRVKDKRSLGSDFTE